MLQEGFVTWCWQPLNVFCVLGVGWWWGRRNKKAGPSLNGDQRLTFLFLVCCLPPLPLVLSHGGTDWSEGRAPSNLFCTTRSESTVYTSTELPRLLCCLACSHSSSSSALGVWWFSLILWSMKCTEAEEEEVTKGKENLLQLSCFINQEVKYLFTGLKLVSCCNFYWIEILNDLCVFSWNSKWHKYT